MSEPSTLRNNIAKAGEYINAAKAALNAFVRPENPCPEVAAQANVPVTYCSSGEVGTNNDEYKTTISQAMINCLQSLHNGVTISFNKAALNYLRNQIVIYEEYKFYQLSKPTAHDGGNNWRKMEKKGPATSIYTKIHATLNIDGGKGVIVIRKSDKEYIGNIISRLSGGGGSAYEYIFVLEESKIPFESVGNPEPHNNASLKKAEQERNNALRELETARSNLAKSTGSNSAALEAALKNAANARSELNRLKGNASSKNAASAAALEKALKNVESAKGELAAAKAEADALKAAASNKQRNNTGASTNTMNAFTAARQASLNRTRKVAAVQNTQQGLLSSTFNTRTAAQKAQASGSVRNRQENSMIAAANRVRKASGIKPAKGAWTPKVPRNGGKKMQRQSRIRKTRR